MKKRILLYLMAISLPLIMGFQALQARRYAVVEAELRSLERSQVEWIESNKRLIAGMAVLRSSARIERIAKDELGMKKIAPEAVMQVKVQRGGRNDG